MDYRVIITEDAETDMEGFVYYLLFEKKNEQAAGRLMDDLVSGIPNKKEKSFILIKLDSVWYLSLRS